MATKSVVIVQQVYRPGSLGWIRSAKDTQHTSGGKVEEAHDLPSGQRQDSKQRKKRVAIVDDEEDLCRLFSIVVKSLGYEGECAAHDGDEIVQAVLAGTIDPDLIVMDYRMPTMNGMQAAERILRVRPEIKIIIASADDSVMRAAVSARMFFLQKPFAIPSLARAIEEALGSPEKS